MSEQLFTGVAAELWQALRNVYDPGKIIAACKRVQALEAERDALRQALVDLTDRLERINCRKEDV